MSADDIHSWANGLLVVSLILGVLATGAIVISGNIREERLKREISTTNLRAETANAEAAKANLELERIKAPRKLALDQQERILNKARLFAGTTFEIVTFPWEPEAFLFSNTIADILVRAGWTLNPNNVDNSILGHLSGVAVIVSKHSGQTGQQIGQVLLESLVSEGVTARLMTLSLQINPTAITIQIQVGTKP